MRYLHAKCVATNCPHQHKCNQCNAWMFTSAFGTKSTGRKAMCMKCSEKLKVRNAKSNAKSNAKTSATKLAKKIEYEEATFHDTIDISYAAHDAAGQQCIIIIEERLEVYKLLYPDGFMLAIYGASTGSYTIVLEGKMQYSGRGNGVPGIVDADDDVISMTLQGPHGPGSEEVLDCGPSKVLSSVVEKAAQEHFGPICDASGPMMPRTWRVPGAGYPKGTGPYKVCIRIMPLPLPFGWHRSF